MIHDTIERINRDTADLPERWRDVLMLAVLEGEFCSEADRLLESAIAAHSCHPPEMETAEAILAGDAFFPMAVETLLDEDVPLKEIDELLARTAGRLNC